MEAGTRASILFSMYMHVPRLRKKKPDPPTIIQGPPPILQDSSLIVQEAPPIVQDPPLIIQDPPHIVQNPHSILCRYIGKPPLVPGILDPIWLSYRLPASTIPQYEICTLSDTVKDNIVWAKTAVDFYLHEQSKGGCTDLLSKYLDAIAYWINSGNEKPNKLNVTMMRDETVPQQASIARGDCGPFICMCLERVTRGGKQFLPPRDRDRVHIHASLTMRIQLPIEAEHPRISYNILPVPYAGQTHCHSSYTPDDLPKIVVMTLSQGSVVKSMDFHPVQQILLLVGTSIGDIMMWEVGSGERIAHKTFKVWDLSTCSMPLQESLANDHSVSVNRVVWSPDGALSGVAYSKHIVHVYSYLYLCDWSIQLGSSSIKLIFCLIEAHVGSVNDLAFSYPNKQLCVVTCGEDRVIKAWDTVSGAKLHTFEGHEAPVYSICPHHKENIQFIFSTATDGKIKAWLYDNMGSRVDYNAPGQSSTTMAYSADGTRLFSCGTNKEGESFLVEWNESEGSV
ncbi:topless-related protein 4-like [Hibiscus syriacus]|uniref:topless-related protein 4-like n=1 Tax=Hibiscus syriacus TaxID=106335 RepID=UPI001921BEAB|nr:topless-related protein 4-like [Hibiscus syriacus]